MRAANHNTLHDVARTDVLTAPPNDGAGKRYWERHARRYDRATRILARPVPRMLELAVDAARGNQRVLEVAAGTGLVTTEVGDLVATDYAQAMVRQLAAHVTQLGLPNVRCMAAELYELPFEPGSFDAVFAANVLHLVPDLDAALASLRRVVRHGGLVMAPTYLHGETFVASVLSRVIALTGFPGRRRFTRATLRHAIERAGFVVEREEVIAGPLPIGLIRAVAR